MIPEEPLVSCLCLTHHKLEFLKRSIKCFFNQTYANKELILVYTNDNKDAIDFLDHIADERIVKVELPAKTTLTLGEKRNLSIEKSNGFYFCNWDDDDWCKDDRLDYQVKRLKITGKKCSMIDCIILYDLKKKRAFLSRQRPSPQTLLCEKSIINFRDIKYESWNRGEDHQLLTVLSRYSIIDVSFNPGMYIYTYHGRNTWNRRFWNKNHLYRNRKLPEDKFEILTNILNSTYTPGEARSYMDRIITPFCGFLNSYT